jgi:CHAT domain-containing protein
LNDAEGLLAGKASAVLHGKRRALQVTIQQVQAKLPTNGVLIEFVRYTSFASTNTESERYGALVIAASGLPHWIPLDTSATALDLEIQDYRRMIENPSISEKEMRKVLSNLYQHVWLPAESAFPAATREVIISPDGELNFLSFATLVDTKGKFLAEQYDLSYVASGRDLIAAIEPSDSRDLCVVAGPAYDLALAPGSLSQIDLLAKRSVERFQPCLSLRETINEGTNLLRRAGNWGFTTTPFFVNDATEARLKSIHHPHILHLATHGFFWGVPPPPAHETGEDSEWFHSPLDLNNPMYRSGVVLAGANTTLHAWKEGRVPPPESDGVLFSAEAAELDLRGTWLVVLSACQTGLGESRSGEGVMGLRRAFVKAGAQNVLLTLWSVYDRYSAEWMTEYYDLLIKRGNPSAALAELQRKELVKLRERDFVSAVQKAGPYMLSRGSF